MKEFKLVRDSKTIMTEMIMPNDANPLGNLMGGYLMRWIDIAGGICAAKHCGSHVVTASVDHVSFREGINVGDVITIEASVTRAFNTSVEVSANVYVHDITGKNRRKSNHAFLTFVSIDKKSRKPQKVPKLNPTNKEEKKLYKSASRRRELRLILGGRLEPSEAIELKDFFLQAK